MKKYVRLQVNGEPRLLRRSQIDEIWFNKEMDEYQVRMRNGQVHSIVWNNGLDMLGSHVSRD